MSNYVYTYATIVSKAEDIKKSVEAKYELGETSKWAYYIAKAILKPKTDIKKIKFTTAKNSNGDNFGRQIYKSDYTDMAKRFTAYVEKHNQLPNNIGVKGMKMRVSDYTYMFSRILVYYHNHGQLPKYANVNSKAFVKPTETENVVYDYWVKKFGFKPKCIDDVCDYIIKHFNYQFYFDDHKSNKEVIDTKSGNCTDISQMVVNMGIALGYDWEIIHTRCNQSGTGHVYPRFRKGGDWFTRDVACMADESRYCVWCEVPNYGSLIAKTPSWWKQNLNR